MLTGAARLRAWWCGPAGGRARVYEVVPGRAARRAPGRLGGRARARGWSRSGVRARSEWGTCGVLGLTRTCGRRGRPRVASRASSELGSGPGRGRWVRPLGVYYAPSGSATPVRPLLNGPGPFSRHRTGVVNREPASRRGQRKARRRTTSRLHPHPQTRSAALPRTALVGSPFPMPFPVAQVVEPALPAGPAPRGPFNKACSRPPAPGSSSQLHPAGLDLLKQAVIKRAARQPAPGPHHYQPERPPTRRPSPHQSHS